MVGKSTRFFNAGYKVPKFQLTIDGTTVFAHSVLSFEKYFDTDEFYFIVRRDYDTPNFVESEIKKLKIKRYKIQILENETEGQAETVYLGLSNIHKEIPIYIFNIDTFRPDYIKPDFVNECDGYLEVFRGEGDQWSFIQTDAFNQKVTRTAEKKRISDLCSDGLYYFNKKKLFDQAFMNALKFNNKVKSEYYIAPLYNYLIKNKFNIKYEIIDKSKIHFCGVPKDYEHLSKIKYKRRIL
jgi:hypothetical protein